MSESCRKECGSEVSRNDHEEQMVGSTGVEPVSRALPLYVSATPTSYIMRGFERVSKENGNLTLSPSLCFYYSILDTTCQAFLLRFPKYFLHCRLCHSNFLCCVLHHQREYHLQLQKFPLVCHKVQC